MIKTIRAYVFQPKDPPTEIQLWTPGDNATDYGVHRWTERSIREVMARYEARGNPIQLDVEHNGATPPDPKDPPPTAGYARLEIRGGAPWLIFDWSAYAVDQIQTGQRRFLSPEYEVDTKTGEIVRLARVSLVGDPATHNARILAAAQRVRAMGGRMDPKVAQAAIEALAAGDGDKALEILKAALVAAAGAGGAPAPEAAAAPAAPPPPDAAPAPGPEEDKEKMTATAPKPAAPAPVAAVAASTSMPNPPRDLAADFDAFKRDALLKEHGARLTEPVRVWASTQPLAVVEGLIKASPEAAKPVAKAAPATRGAGQGARASALPASEKEELDRRMGVRRVAAGVKREAHGITFGVLTSEDVKTIRAARGKAVA